MRYMVVTWLTSQLLMFSLKFVLPLNMLSMSVTRDTSQFATSAQTASVLSHVPVEMQASTWVLSVARSPKQFIGLLQTPHVSSSSILPDEPSNISVLEAVESCHSWHNICENAFALLNIYCMLVTSSTSHPEMSWLKTVASLNIYSMLVTLETSQLSGWLKSPALRNINPMSITFSTFQLLIDWSNTYAEENM